VIKAIIFDFFGVICSDEYWNFVKEEKDAGGEFDQLSRKLNLGQISWKDFVAEVARDTHQEAGEVERMYIAQKIHPEIVTFIAKLQRRYKTALMTNANREQLVPIIDQAGLSKVFSEIFISSDYRLIKPDPKFFSLVLGKLQVEPHEAIFIDDISRYVVGAQNLGINAIWYNNFGQMKAELARFLTGSDN
jgi:epoxide hydrolase-like predicted phosphatase